MPRNADLALYLAIGLLGTIGVVAVEVLPRYLLEFNLVYGQF